MQLAARRNHRSIRIEENHRGFMKGPTSRTHRALGSTKPGVSPRSTPGFTDRARSRARLQHRLIARTRGDDDRLSLNVALCQLTFPPGHV